MGLPPRGVRYVLTLILTAAALFFGSWGYVVLQNLWSHQDSPAWVYLTLGLPLVAISMGCVVGIVVLLRLAGSQQKSRRELW